MFTRKNPEVSHLKIFGCPLYIHIPKKKRTKLDPSEKKGIFVGYCEVSKSFRIYISRFHHMDITMDVTFDEEETLKRSKKCQHEEVYEEDVPPKNVEVAPSPENETPEDHDMLEPQEPPTMNMSQKRKLAWAREIIQEEEKYGAPEGSIRVRKKPKPFSNYLALMCDLVDQEPTSHEEAIQKKEWVEV